jgi:hypothetical protein
MNKYKAFFAVAALFVLVFAARSFYQDNALSFRAMASSSSQQYETTAKRDLLALMMAYPKHIDNIELDGQSIYVVMNSGDKIVYDDLKIKNFDEKLANADIQDMMEIDYPLHSIDTLMDENCDPGRIRCYQFLHAVYGSSRGDIEANLINVDLGTGSSAFNGQNSAADALAEVFSSLSRLLKSEPEVYGFVYPLSGTYNYRVIAGTGQLSPHAFAIAIDLKRDDCDYWQWANKEQGQGRLDEYPPSLVDLFECHGFIWGGKWSHFDFLHYEYRPELIAKALYTADDNGENLTWHDGFPYTEETRAYIDIINHAWMGTG